MVQNEYSIADEFIYTTMGEISEIIENMNKFKYENMDMYKNLLKIQIMHLSNKYGFANWENYLYKREFGQPINIDVIWRGKSSMIISMFIITDYYNERVRRSLCLCDAPYKFWIYLGNKEIDNIKEIVKMSNVHFMPMSEVNSDLLCYS